MTPTQFCQLVENRLGWQPPPGPAFKRYRVEASKVARKVASNPLLYTMENLILTVQLLANERKERTPIGVFSHVERALFLAMDVEVDVELEIRRATNHELMRGDPDGWVSRFARSVGGYRKEVLDEWKASHKNWTPRG